MLEYVHHELVKLMMKRESSTVGCIFDDNGNETADNNCNPVGATVSGCRDAELVLSSVANLVHLCGEDVGLNPAWKISCR